MSKEELLKMLRDAGMEDEAIAALLNEALQDVQAPAPEAQPENPEADDAAAAGKLLGVEF